VAHLESVNNLSIGASDRNPMHQKGPVPQRTPARRRKAGSRGALLLDVDDPVRVRVGEAVVVQLRRRVHGDLEGDRAHHRVAVVPPTLQEDPLAEHAMRKGRPLTVTSDR
jgi:hypothetical protein